MDGKLYLMCYNTPVRYNFFEKKENSMIEYVRVQNLKKGDVSARALFEESGRVFIKEGQALDEETLLYLKHLGYKGIYIQHIGQKRRELIPLPDPLLDNALLIKLFYTFKRVFDNKNIIYDVNDPVFMADKTVLEGLIEEIVDTLIQADKEGKLLFEMQDQRSFNTWIYFHSINVCFLSIAIAIKLGMSKKEILEVALGAIYHDMGKGRMDDYIVNRTNLSEKERMLLRDHPTNMFYFLKKHHYPMNTLYAVWQHHEKIDGSGYPKGLKQGQIFKSAHIVACANAYDHHINKNPYGDAHMYPSEAIEYMCANQEQDLECLKAMLQVVVPYSVGTKVRLSDDSVAIVVKNSVHQPLRPIVLINKELVHLDSDSAYLNVTIKGVIE